MVRVKWDDREQPRCPTNTGWRRGYRTWLNGTSVTLLRGETSSTRSTFGSGLVEQQELLLVGRLKNRRPPFKAGAPAHFSKRFISLHLSGRTGNRDRPSESARSTDRERFGLHRERANVADRGIRRPNATSGPRSQAEGSHHARGVGRPAEGGQPEEVLGCPQQRVMVERGVRLRSGAHRGCDHDHWNVVVTDSFVPCQEHDSLAGPVRRARQDGGQERGEPPVAGLHRAVVAVMAHVWGDEGEVRERPCLEVPG
jgi:hypothetical protein